MICNSCYGWGKLQCWKCEGKSVFSVDCEDCHRARFRVDNKGVPITCKTCAGHGSLDGVCETCNGSSVLGCERCDGQGNVIDAIEDEG
jgi:DnaJ-class molecular chaperone